MADSQAFSPVKEVVSEQRQGGKSPAYLPAQKQGRQQGHTKTFRVLPAVDAHLHLFPNAFLAIREGSQGNQRQGHVTVGIQPALQQTGDFAVIDDHSSLVIGVSCSFTGLSRRG